MQLKTLDKVLNKKILLTRVIEIIRKSLSKSKFADIDLYLINILENPSGTTDLDHYLALMLILKDSRNKLDVEIKRKIRDAIKKRKCNIEELMKRARRPMYIFTKKDYPRFLEYANRFFSEYSGPFEGKFPKKGKVGNRIYLGIAFEMLLKAIYLKKGYRINCPNKNGMSVWNERKLTLPFKPRQLERVYLSRNTVQLDDLIKNLDIVLPKKIHKEDAKYYIEHGLRLAQEWRNTDAHIPVNFKRIDIIQMNAINSAKKLLYKIFFNNAK